MFDTFTVALVQLLCVAQLVRVDFNLKFDLYLLFLCFCFFRLSVIYFIGYDLFEHLIGKPCCTCWNFFLIYLVEFVRNRHKFWQLTHIYIYIYVGILMYIYLKFSFRLLQQLLLFVLDIIFSCFILNAKTLEICLLKRVAKCALTNLFKFFFCFCFLCNFLLFFGNFLLFGQKISALRETSKNTSTQRGIEHLSVSPLSERTAAKPVPKR